MIKTVLIFIAVLAFVIQSQAHPAEDPNSNTGEYNRTKLCRELRERKRYDHGALVLYEKLCRCQTNPTTPSTTTTTVRYYTPAEEITVCYTRCGDPICYRCFTYRVDQIDMSEHDAWVLEIEEYYRTSTTGAM